MLRTFSWIKVDQVPCVWPEHSKQESKPGPWCSDCPRRLEELSDWHLIQIAEFGLWIKLQMILGAAYPQIWQHILWHYLADCPLIECHLDVISHFFFHSELSFLPSEFLFTLGSLINCIHIFCRFSSWFCPVYWMVPVLLSPCITDCKFPWEGNYLDSTSSSKCDLSI